MAKITRIKASDPKKSPEEPLEAPKTVAKVKVAKGKALNKKTQKSALKEQAAPKKTEKGKTAKSKTSNKQIDNTTKKPFILIRPFVYFGRYIRDSWREIRQVRWPSRKAAWKLFFAILIYTLIFVGVIMLLDALFTWLFETVIG